MTASPRLHAILRLLLGCILLVTLIAACENDGTEHTEGTAATSAEPSADPDPVADPDPEAVNPIVARESVDVALGEFWVEPAGVAFSAGAIRFDAENQGSITHELVICANSCEAGEEAELAEVEDVAPGEERSFTIELTPGEYELACLINEDGTDHYSAGMRTRIMVN